MQALEMQAEVKEGHEIRLQLPQHIQRGTVRVIVLYEQEEAQEPAPHRRRFGQFRGRMAISRDFDDALPDTFWSGEGA